MATSSKRLMLCPGLLHPESLPLRLATADPYLHRRHSNTVLAQSLWGLWVLVHTRFVWAFWAFLAGKGFDSKCDFTPPIVLLHHPWWRASPSPLDMGYIFLLGSNILQLTVVQQWVVVLEFPQEKMRAHPSIPPSLCYVDISTRGFLFTCLFFLFRMHWVSWTRGFKSFINSQSLFLQLLSLSNSPSSIFLRLF